MNDLHSLTGYIAEGLILIPIDLSRANFGKALTRWCWWFAELQGGMRGSLGRLGLGGQLCQFLVTTSPLTAGTRQLTDYAEINRRI